MRYFTSDLHFGHKGIIEYCKRPFASVQENIDFFIDEINSLPADSELWILGDYSFLGVQKTLEITQKMIPKITIVRGNHDRSNVMKRLGEIGVTVLDTHDTQIDFLSVTVSHYPFRDDRYPDRCPPDDGRVVVHGHIHAARGIARNQVNVGWDYWHRILNEEEVGDMITQSMHYAM